MSTVDETVSKVDQGLQEMGIGSVKESIKDILDFKQYLQDQIPAVDRILHKSCIIDHCIFCRKKNHPLASESHAAFAGTGKCGCRC